ncbi:MAG: hypothetical protein WB774_27275 [Xanthobacteraceae bacterium]
MERQFSQTMGNIIRRVNAVTEFGDDLKERIVAAKKRRDLLTHHYWRERSIQFATANGRLKMRQELENDMEMFAQVDREVDAAMSATRKKLRINDKIEKYNAEFMRKAAAGEITE